MGERPRPEEIDSEKELDPVQMEFRYRERMKKIREIEVELGQSLGITVEVLHKRFEKAFDKRHDGKENELKDDEKLILALYDKEGEIFEEHRKDREEQAKIDYEYIKRKIEEI